MNKTLLKLKTTAKTYKDALSYAVHEFKRRTTPGPKIVADHITVTAKRNKSAPWSYEKEFMKTWFKDTELQRGKVK